MSHPQRILLVDDTPSNLSVLGEALADDYDLQVADSGELGLDLARRSPPDLVLLDVMMPGIDGYEICRRLKADAHLRHVPVVFISALAEPGAEAEGLALGAADYLYKPVNVAIARQRIRNLLERERLVALLGQQRDELATSEAFKRGILDSVDDEIAVLDGDGVIIATNRAWERFHEENHGARPEHDGTSVGANYLAACERHAGRDGELARQAAEGIRAVLAGEVASYALEYPCHAPDRKRWFLMRVTPLQPGRSRGAVVAHTDITARKAGEERLALAGSVFENAREGIVITTLAAEIIDVNAAFEQITGYARAEVIGRNPSLLKSGRQDGAFYEGLWQSLATRGHWYGEVWNRRKDGSAYATMLNISVARDAQGRPRHYVGLFSDITALKVHEDHLEHIAHYDSLTNLPNRVLLSDRLLQAMTRCQSSGTQIALVYIDLDGFKGINDLHGHGTGDQFLVTCATRIRNCLRDSDTLARLGGDEFVAILPDLTTSQSCFNILGRILAEAASPVQVGNMTLQVSASAGVTFFPQSEPVDADQLLRQADQAMYIAKQSGKNRYVCFDVTSDSLFRLQREAVREVEEGLARHEFVLHYQPRVDMRSGEVVGAEALVRWEHPLRGLLMPRDFLPEIEDRQVVVALGEWVLRTALRQALAWRSQGIDLVVSVNVAARHLQQPDFVQRLGDALAAATSQAAGDEPPRLELEILETSALEDIVRVSGVIEECSRMGVGFALDDFGTGYSSLTYLKGLPVQVLKVDQGFVRDMLRKPGDRAIVDGIIGLGHAFGRTVVAEGVETVELGRALLAKGCVLGQGYGISPPLPPQGFLKWLGQWQHGRDWKEELAGEPARPPATRRKPARS